VAASNINRVTITGNLTKDPELRSSGTGLPICGLRVAVNTRAKDNSTGEWGERPNYFSVTVFGAQGENCSRYLSKGRGVAVDGRLSWREYTDKDGNKREAVEIIADTVQFLGGGEGGGGGQEFRAQRTDVPANNDDFAPPAPAAVGGGNQADEDIPF
jgi:single-strand DNA-binding protein